MKKIATSFNKKVRSYYKEHMDALEVIYKEMVCNGVTERTSNSAVKRIVDGCRFDNNWGKLHVTTLLENAYNYKKHYSTLSRIKHNRLYVHDCKAISKLGKMTMILPKSDIKLELTSANHTKPIKVISLEKKYLLGVEIKYLQ